MNQERESSAVERGEAGEGLSEKVTLEKDLRDEPQEHLKKIFLAEETAGAKALG